MVEMVKARSNISLQGARVSLLEDHRQERLFPTTIGGGATTVELVHQVVGHRRQSGSLKLAGFGL